MSTYVLLSFGLISFLLLISILSCSSIPINAVSHHDRYSPMINSEEEYIPIISPNDLSFSRFQRSSSYYPRTNRNTWFRVSTHQHFKPSGSEDTPNGDNLMRWGR